MNNIDKNLGVTPLDGCAHRMHEICTAFVTASFSPDQAISLGLELARKGKYAQAYSDSCN